MIKSRRVVIVRFDEEEARINEFGKREAKSIQAREFGRPGKQRGRDERMKNKMQTDWQTRCV